MKNKLKAYIKKFSNNNFLKTYTLIMLPVLIVMIFFMISAISYNNNFVKLLKNSYFTKLESLSSETEATLRSISSTVTLLSDNSDFMMAINAENELDSGSNYKVRKILTQVVGNNTQIDNILIFNRKNNIVYTNNGTYHSTVFFSNDYIYSEYTIDYWRNFITPQSQMKILTPSIVNSKDTAKTIIPIAITTAGNHTGSSLIIVNVNLSSIIDSANHSKLTDNSNFLIINKKNRQIFTESGFFDKSLSDNFYDSIKTDMYKDLASEFDCVINNSTMLILSYFPGNSILSYAYAAVIPYTDIHNNLSNVTYFVAILGIFFIFVVLLVAYFSTKRIFTPIKKLASLFDGNTSYLEENNNSATDILAQLHSSIQETIDSNRSLSKEMLKSLPLVQERYLINLLNSNEHYIPNKADIDMPIDFIYEYFCSIVIKLSPTEQFYESYNNIEYNAIKTGIHNIIQSIFSENYETYIIPSETDTLYVLLNLSDNSQTESIIKILEEFQNIMSFDKEYMTLKIGLGGIYSNIDGLKKSHHEATSSVSAVTGPTHIRINIDQQSAKLQIYTFSINDENTLFNHLILGKDEDAKSLINAITEENLSKNVSDTVLIQLYIQIINVIFKVMRMKNIAYDPENCGDLHIITEIIKQPSEMVHDTIMKYVDILGSYMGTTNTKVNIQAIINFMETSYQEELSLELIADKFNTTPKYLSKLIKDKIGMNFVDYLAGMRINAAKILLSESDKSITDIFEEVGFNNRNTFIRTFKKNTGITPSEFRRINKK